MANRRSRSTLWLLALIPSVAAGSALAVAVEIRRANNEMVVLEGVPEVPERLVEQLNRYQNTRGADFEDWDEGGSLSSSPPASGTPLSCTTWPGPRGRVDSSRSSLSR